MLIKKAANGDYTSVARAAWGGIGLDLHAPNEIKTVRPTRLRHPKQKSTGQGTPNKKTHQMVRFNSGAGCRDAKASPKAQISNGVR